MMDDSSADATSTSVSSIESVPPALVPPPPPPRNINPEKSYVDLEAWLAKLTTGTPLTESEVKTLTELARERLLQESNVQPVPAPVTICGDIHVRVPL